MGCYQNRGRALGDILLRDLYSTGDINEKYDRCTKAANEQGITVFGMDDRRCWTGENAESKYDMYGKSTDCKTHQMKRTMGFTVSQTMAVYKKDNNGK